MIYVDEPIFAFRGQMYCHMCADSVEELKEFAVKIGLAPEWYQDKTRHKHFDLAPSKRRLAVRNGAKELGMDEYLLKVKSLVPIWAALGDTNGSMLDRLERAHKNEGQK